MKFGEMMKEAMIKQNISQAELARRTGLKRSTINGYCSGRRTNITLPILNSIMHALDMDALVVMQECPELFEDQVYETNITELSEAVARAYRINPTEARERIGQALTKLNDTGKTEAVKRVEELTEIPRYTEPEE